VVTVAQPGARSVYPVASAAPAAIAAPAPVLTTVLPAALPGAVATALLPALPTAPLASGPFPPAAPFDPWPYHAPAGWPPRASLSTFYGLRPPFVHWPPNPPPDLAWTNVSVALQVTGFANTTNGTLEVPKLLQACGRRPTPAHGQRRPANCGGRRLAPAPSALPALCGRRE